MLSMWRVLLLLPVLLLWSPTALTQQQYNNSDGHTCTGLRKTSIAYALYRTFQPNETLQKVGTYFNQSSATISNVSGLNLHSPSSGLRISQPLCIPLDCSCQNVTQLLFSPVSAFHLRSTGVASNYQIARKELRSEYSSMLKHEVARKKLRRSASGGWEFDYGSNGTLEVEEQHDEEHRDVDVEETSLEDSDSESSQESDLDLSDLDVTTRDLIIYFLVSEFYYRDFPRQRGQPVPDIMVFLYLWYYFGNISTIFSVAIIIGLLAVFVWFFLSYGMHTKTL